MVWILRIDTDSRVPTPAGIMRRSARSVPSAFNTSIRKHIKRHEKGIGFIGIAVIGNGCEGGCSAGADAHAARRAAHGGEPCGELDEPKGRSEHHRPASVGGC